MIDWTKKALSEPDGTPSSSRVNLFVTTGCFVIGFLFATAIIAHSYFVKGLLPDSGSILALYLGGSGVGIVGGASSYWANKKYGSTADCDLEEDDIPAHPTIEGETE